MIISRWKASIVCVLLLAACQETSPSTPPEDDGPTRGGSLVVALTEDPGQLNPAVTTSGATHAAAELLYNGLLSVDDEGNPVPELAADLPEIEGDGEVYTFELRDDVTWHDGEPFTSEDVKFSFEEVLLNFHARTAASMGPALDAIETPDDNTVVFRFKRPYAPLLQQLDVTEAPIIPMHVYEDGDPTTNPANSEPVGTGPFRFASYDEGSEIRYERNPDYFKEDLPYFDDVVLRIIPDPATQLLALENGEVDWLSGVPGPDLERITTDPALETAETTWNPGGSNCIMTMSFNLERPIFGDQRVREAIAHAIDQQQFLDQVLFGQGAVAEAPISSGIPWAHSEEVELPQFDLDEAERLLDDAGWTRQGDGPRVAQDVEGVSDGTELAFDFLHFPNFSKYGELVRAQLRETGIEVTQRPLEPEAFAPAVFEDRDFDTNVISYCNSTDPELGVRRMYDSSQIGPGPFSNSSAYSNPEVDRLFDEAVEEIELSTRGEIYSEIQDVVADDLPYFWLVETISTRAYSADCTGFKFNNGLFAEAAYCER